MPSIKIEVISIGLIVVGVFLYQFLKKDQSLILDKTTQERFCTYYSAPEIICQQDCYNYTSWFRGEGFGNDCSVCSTIKGCASSSADSTRNRFCAYYSNTESICQRDCHDYAIWFTGEGYGDNCAICSTLRECPSNQK